MDEAESDYAEGSVKKKKSNRICSLFSSSRTRNEAPKRKASELFVFWKFSFLAVYGAGRHKSCCVKPMSLRILSIDIRFPDLGTTKKNLRKMRKSQDVPLSHRKSMNRTTISILLKSQVTFRTPLLLGTSGLLTPSSVYSEPSKAYFDSFLWKMYAGPKSSSQKRYRIAVL